MLTSKLRSTTGCLTCRSRRRKCDEGKPACKACIRWSKRCVYPRTKLYDASAPKSSKLRAESVSGVADAYHFSSSRRIADYTPTPNAPVDTELLATFEGIREAFKNSDYLPGRKIEQFLILCIRHEWTSAPDRAKTEWDLSTVKHKRIQEIDVYLRCNGHGQVARLVSLWHCYRFSQVRGPRLAFVTSLIRM